MRVLWICWGRSTTYIDKKNGNKVISEKGSRQDQTDALLELLRQKVSDMSLVNFFVAGSGRKVMFLKIMSDMLWDTISVVRCLM